MGVREGKKVKNELFMGPYKGVSCFLKECSITSVMTIVLN
jgi:hypothetical protein